MKISYFVFDPFGVKDLGPVLSLPSAGVFFISWFKSRASSHRAPVAESAAPQEQKAAEDPDLEALRAKHQVRPLSDQEEGYGLDRLPDGVYGFTCAVGQWDAPLFGKRIYQSFEMHKLSDGTALLVGFVSPDDAARMDTAKESVSIHLFPDPQEEARTLVSVPMHRIVRHKEHSQRSGKGLELELEPED